MLTGVLDDETNDAANVEQSYLVFMIAVGTMMSADKRRYWPWWCWPTMTTTATTTTTTTTKMLSNISNDHNRTQRISSSSSAAASTTYLILVLNSLLLLLSHVDCDIDSGSNIFNHSKPFYFSTKANPPNVTRRAVDNVVPTSSSAFDTNRTHQPLINLSSMYHVVTVVRPQVDLILCFDFCRILQRTTNSCQCTVEPQAKSKAFRLDNRHQSQLHV